MTTTPYPNLNVRAALLAGWTKGKRKEYSFVDPSKTIKNDSWFDRNVFPHRRPPHYTEDLSAIHAEVQRMTPEQRVKFQLALDDSADAKNCQPCELDAATWTECFVNVMEGEKTK